MILATLSARDSACALSVLPAPQTSGSLGGWGTLGWVMLYCQLRGRKGGGVTLKQVFVAAKQAQRCAKAPLALRQNRFLAQSVEDIGIVTDGRVWNTNYEYEVAL